MKRLLDRWRAHREARVLERRAIPDDLWALTLARLPFLARRADEDLARLRKLASLFLDEKEFTGAGGLVVDDSMAVYIAAQACLPVLHIGLEPYRSFVGIVVHPDEVQVQREVVDDDGVVHVYDDVISGEAVAGGPMMLSWHDLTEGAATAEQAYNVVIHEFAHVLDMGDGDSDGVPPLPSARARDDWIAVIDAEYERFCETVDNDAETVLDPYGATSVDEFFAVAAESFFVTPKEMRAEHPVLYEMLARYFQQDPATY
ncbi:zinc-dependent peptidase [Aquabacterium sp.]|uniref:M90 family metallopeptidase n=1 Tax=Aquabacterium sp. TaxID=1872578 RepID=UPI002B703BA0|nr:M90 family metallopeptidase [Aquabacterium sp.]HSW04540.1 M90 family metallopeptidase [Aquabacterium sp.]